MISVIYKKLSLNFMKFSRIAIRDSTKLKSLNSRCAPADQMFLSVLVGSWQKIKSDSPPLECWYLSSAKCAL